MKFFTHSHGKQPVVFPPDDHGRVRDAAEAWSEIGFPGGEGVSHGHDGFDDAGASAIAVGPFDNGRREEAVVMDDFLEDRLGDQPAEQPVAEGDEPGRSSRLQGLPERAAGELGLDMRRQPVDEHEFVDAGRMSQCHSYSQPSAHGIADQCGLRNLQGIHESDTEVQHLIRQVIDVRFVGQSGAGQVERQRAEVLGQRMLLMFPLPHGSTEAMDQNDRGAGTDIEIRDPLIMDENSFDRNAFYRSTFQCFKIGRDL